MLHHFYGKARLSFFKHVYYLSVFCFIMVKKHTSFQKLIKVLFFYNYNKKKFGMASKFFKNIIWQIGQKIIYKIVFFKYIFFTL